VFWKRREQAKKLNSSDVLSILCPECRLASLDWDGVLYPSLFVRTDKGTRTQGQIGLLCQTCEIGVVFDVTSYSQPAFEFERVVRVTEVPKNVCNIEPVDRDRMIELKHRKGTAVFATELRLFEMMVRDTDTICWYSTEFGALSGSAGYAIVRDGSIFATLTTIQS
jgi:hypothetical protein